ncbi:hypothetical protein CCP2SC5_380002 [Azospirillaceae bacterium]
MFLVVGDHKGGDSPSYRRKANALQLARTLIFFSTSKYVKYVADASSSLLRR